MRIMISQPMRNKSPERVSWERRELYVIDTIFTEEAPKDCDESIYYLAKSIEAIGKVDAVIFMPGWENARGCRIEHQVAANYGKFIKEL